MANVKITELPVGAAVDGTEEMPLVQGAITKKTTIDDIKTYINGTGQFGCTFSSTTDIEVSAICDVVVPYGMIIEEVTVLGNTSGNIVIDVWVDSFASFPPTIADTITASAPPTLASSNKSTDVTLTGWTTTIVAGSIVRFSVISCTGISQATVIIKGSKT